MERTKIKRPLFLLLAAYVCVLLFLPLNKIPEKDIYHSAPQEGVAEGVVLSYPQSSKNGGSRAAALVTSFNGRKVKSKTYLYIPAGAEVKQRESFSATGALRRPYGVKIEGSFDWEKYLNNKNIYTEFSAKEITVVKKAPFLIRGVNYVREYILNIFRSNFDAESNAVLSGIVLGAKEPAPEELEQAFKDSGAMHLLVASGGNVAFAALIIYALCMLFGAPYRLRMPLALAFAGFYTVLAGADPPLVRAYIMTLAAGIGLRLGRNSGALHSVLTAAFVILLVSPKSLYDVSFQMSFLAAFIIIYSSGVIKFPDAWPKTARGAAQIFFITLCVQLALLPVFTNIFYRVSVAAVASNIFLVPLAEVCMLLGFLLCAASVLKIGFIFKLFWAVCWLSLELFKTLVKFFSMLPFAALDCGALNALSIIIFYIALLSLFTFKNKKVLACCAALLLLSPLFSVLYRPDFLYLINYRGENAVVFKTKGKTGVITNSLDPGVLRRFLFAKGFTRADFAAGYTELDAKEKIIPFYDFWPGGGVTLGKTPAQTMWGVMPAATGFWENTGYSGSAKDSVSYKFMFGQKEIATGGTYGFVFIDGEEVWGKRNSSVKVL